MAIVTTNLHEFGPQGLACSVGLLDEDGVAFLDERDNAICTETFAVDVSRANSVVIYFDWQFGVYDTSSSGQFPYEVSNTYGQGGNEGIHWNFSGSGTKWTSGIGDGPNGGNCWRWRLAASINNYCKMMRPDTFSGSGDPAIYSVLSTDPATICFWIWPGSITTQQMIWQCGTQWDASFAAVGVYIDTDGTVSFDVGNGSSRNPITTVEPLTLSAWNFVACTHDPVTNEIGIRIGDNPLIYATYTGSPVNVPQAPAFGRRNKNSGSDWPIAQNTRLAYFAALDYVNSDEELDTIYNGGVPLTSGEFFSAAMDSWPAGGPENGIGTHYPGHHIFIPDNYSCADNTSWHNDNFVSVDGTGVITLRNNEYGYNGGGDTTSLYMPVYKTGIQNGLPILRFDSVTPTRIRSIPYYGAFYDNANTITETTIFFAGSTTSTGCIINLSSGSSLKYPKLFAHSDGRIRFNDFTTSVYADVGDAVGSGVFFIGAVTYNAGAVRVFMNGAFSASGTTTNVSYYNGFPSSNIGTSQNNTPPTQDLWSGDLGQLLVYNEQLSDADVIAIMDWMNDIWAVY